MTHTSSRDKEHYTLLMGNRGRLVLPAPVRRRLGLQEGDNLILTVEDDGSPRIVSAREAVRRARGLLRAMLPGAAGRSLVDELIRERRREAERE